MNEKHDKSANTFSIYQMTNQNMTARIYGCADKQEDIELVLKKRKALIHYTFPVKWTSDQYWAVTIDFSCYDFSGGYWDYYIKGKSASEKQGRISVDENLSLDQFAPLYCPANKGSKSILHYETEKGNASFVSKKEKAHLSGLTSDVHEDGNVSIAARLDGKPIWQHDNEQHATISIRERNSQQTSTVPCELEKKDRKYYLSFQVNYDTIAQVEPSKNRTWDVFIHLYINGMAQGFQLALTSNQIANDSRKQFDDEHLHQMFFYQTTNSHLGLTYTEVQLKRNVERYHLSRNTLFIKGYAYLDAVSLSDKDVMERSIIIKDRQGDKESVIPLKSVIFSENNFQLKIPLKNMIPDQGAYEIYDLYVELRYKHITKRRKLGCDPYVYYKDDILAETERTQAFRKLYVRHYLTYTPAGNLKIEAYKLSHRVKKYLNKGQYNDQVTYANRDVWLIGERSDTAQDTGYHLFKYCRTHYPNQEIYYVIDADSRDLGNVEELGNVLYQGSYEHFKKAAIANMLIGSHDLEYILPIKGLVLDSYKTATKVFLQHGVLGRKTAEYHKQYYQYPFHMFCVSSTPEKKLVHKQMAYENEEIKVVGLSRFDKLLSPHTEKRSILVIPTWREWLKDEDTFMQSEYFRRYKSLLESERLQKMLARYDVDITFYPHYRMQSYVGQFDFMDNERIHVVSQGEKSVQTLLLENKLMITDYSSVSFDFNYMSKPVIFYHFDQDSFFKNGKLRPINETFLGDICLDEKTVMDQLEDYLQHNFAEKQEIEEQKYLVFDHIDQKNCERIYKEIENLQV